MTTQSSQSHNNGLIQQYIAQQQTVPHQATTSHEPLTTPISLAIPEIYPIQAPPEIPEQVMPSTPPTKRLRMRRIATIVLVCMLGLGTYFIWHTSSSSSATTPAVSTAQQQFSMAPTASVPEIGTTTPLTTTNGKIQVYIVGAVKKPGVYTLEGGARIYNLLQAAGGPLASANLITLNLAAPLSDGEEIYVTRIGETPPASVSITPNSTPTSATSGTTGNTSSQQININTASADALRTTLHISSKNAQAIISYRMQHGPFTSVEALLQVLSQATYKKIKNEVKLA